MYSYIGGASYILQAGARITHRLRRRCFQPSGNMQQSLPPVAAEAEGVAVEPGTGTEVTWPHHLQLKDTAESAGATNEEDCVRAKEYSPYSFSKEVAWLDELNKMLTEAKQRLAEASTRSLLLNVDLVTQLDPHMVDSLGQLVQDCDACAAKMDHGDENHQFTDVDDLS